VITSIVSVFLVVLTVLLLSSKISDGPCPVIQGAISGLLFDRNPGGVGGVWSLAMLDLGPAYAGCLAHPGPPLLVRVLDYEGDPAGGR
jgi:hypothetical protein